MCYFCYYRLVKLQAGVGQGRGVLERGAILEIRLDRGALKTLNGLEHGEILEMAGARSVESKIRGWSAEHHVQKGSNRGALFTPGPLPQADLV